MLTLSNIQVATQGHLVQSKRPMKIKGVSIDSRTLKKGDLYIAIKGKRFNGHKFIKQAIKKGASAIMVESHWLKEFGGRVISSIGVKDTTLALGQIAAFHRNQFAIRMIAVTGSAGKTTTKDIIAAILKTQMKVLKNSGTQNNQYGVALTLLKMNKSHNIAVLELGISQCGDMDYLSRMVRPTVSVFTNIGESHLEGLKTPAGVFREKFHMVKYTSPQGAVIYNGDDPYLQRLANIKMSQKKIPYGLQGKTKYKIQRIKSEGNRKILFKMDGKNFMLKTPVEHNLMNTLASISCGRLCNINYNNIRKALARFKFCSSRQEIKKIGKFWCIDDTYNANPISFVSAIKTLNDFKTRGKKVLICADMAELGTQSIALHQSLGKVIAQSSIDNVITIGRNAQHITNTLKKRAPSIRANHYALLARAHQHLKGLCQPGDVILIKGSRSMKMERTVKFLEKM